MAIHLSFSLNKTMQLLPHGIHIVHAYTHTTNKNIHDHGHALKAAHV